MAGQAPQPCTGGWGCNLASRFFGRLSLGAGRDFSALAECVRVAAARACACRARARSAVVSSSFTAAASAPEAASQLT